jgi:hypothetical protein
MEAHSGPGFSSRRRARAAGRSRFAKLLFSLTVNMCADGVTGVLRRARVLRTRWPVEVAGCRSSWALRSSADPFDRVSTIGGGGWFGGRVWAGAACAAPCSFARGGFEREGFLAPFFLEGALDPVFLPDEDINAIS